MSAINSGLASISSCFNAVTASAQTVETLARAAQIYSSMAEQHARFCYDKQTMKNKFRLEKLEQRVQRELEKEDSFL